MPSELQVAEGLVRIRVPLERPAGEAGPPDDWLWAEPLGSGRYRIESCPFFAYGVSREDVVQAVAATAQEAPALEDIVEKSGHRTLRLALDASLELGAAPVQGLLERLLQLGCTYELLRPKIVAIDLPAEADLSSVAELLLARAREGALVWEWADPRPS